MCMLGIFSPLFMRKRAPPVLANTKCAPAAGLVARAFLVSLHWDAFQPHQSKPSIGMHSSRIEVQDQVKQLVRDAVQLRLVCLSLFGFPHCWNTLIV